MYLLALNIVALALYLALVLWCLTPLVRVSDSYKPNWFRVIPGFLLLGANMLPPLAWPVVFLTGIFLDDRTVERLTTAVPLFVRTLPIYISNLAAWSFSTASLVEIAYPIEIADIKYRPVLQMGCTTRRMVSIDKAVSIHFFNDFPTLSGTVLASAGDATIVIDQPNGICSMVKHGRLSPGSFPHSIFSIGSGPVLYVIRGKDDNKELYDLRYSNGATQIITSYCIGQTSSVSKNGGPRKSSRSCFVADSSARRTRSPSAEHR